MSVHQKLLVSKYTAIVQLIYGQLVEAVSIYARTKENKIIEKKDIPLSKGKNDIKISYISGIALHLSNSHNSQPFSIASSIASHLSANWGEYLLIHVVSPGLICIEVSDFFLAAWLQRFIDIPKGKKVDFTPLALKTGSEKTVMAGLDDFVFSIQYVHARCCSMLRLVHHEKLIDLNQFSSESIQLDSYGRLYLNHKAERHLISSLVKILDELEPVIVRPVKWEGAALRLVKAFESFWSNCRICGDLKITKPELFISRIALVMTTQSVLKFVLEEKLGIPACLEL
ncbi:MAG: DALR anticodon-binding domain-containing protein [Cyanobacteria bacterium P01_D01_bin.50]